MNCTFRNALVATLFVGACVASSAAPITIDFSDPAIPGGGLRTNNFVTQGYVFSPQCHYDLLTGGAYNVLATDTPASCSAGTVGAYNPDYLGPNSSPRQGRIFIQAEDGSDFSLLSVDSPFGNWGMINSNGASYGQPGGTFPTHITFNGPEWLNASWIMFIHFGADPIGVGNFVLERTVDAPGSLALATIGMLGMVALSRRRKLSVAD